MSDCAEPRRIRLRRGRELRQASGCEDQSGRRGGIPSSFIEPRSQSLSETVILSIAGAADLAVAATLLKSNDLSTDGLGVDGSVYWLAGAPEAKGVCGVEVDGGYGLLRSLAVSQDDRGRGLAKTLVDHAQAWAREQGLIALYTFSKDTGPFFERRGWDEVPVAEAADQLRGAHQVRRYERLGWYEDERAFRFLMASQI